MTTQRINDRDTKCSSARDPPRNSCARQRQPPCTCYKETGSRLGDGSLPEFGASVEPKFFVWPFDVANPS